MPMSGPLNITTVAPLAAQPLDAGVEAGGDVVGIGARAG